MKRLILALLAGATFRSLARRIGVAKPSQTLIGQPQIPNRKPSNGLKNIAGLPTKHWSRCC
jgi:hypothetical protein